MTATIERLIRLKDRTADQDDRDAISAACLALEENCDLRDAMEQLMAAGEKVIARTQRLAAEIIEREAELIYLRKHGKHGALWSANESKDVWRGMALASLEGSDI